MQGVGLRAAQRHRAVDGIVAPLTRPTGYYKVMLEEVMILRVVHGSWRGRSQRSHQLCKRRIGANAHQPVIGRDQQRQR
jgi:hypothetical protein